MARKEIGVELDRENRNNHNTNYEYLFGVIVETVEKIKSEISQETLDQIIEESRVNWLEAVDTESQLPTDAEVGDAVFVVGDNKAYRYDGEQWVFFQALDSSAVDALRVSTEEMLSDFMAIYETRFDEQEELTRRKTVEVSATEPEYAEVWFEVVE